MMVMVTKLLTAVSIVLATTSLSVARRVKSRVLIESNFYLVDNGTFRTRDQAKAFCVNEKAGELAKITKNKIYTVLIRHLSAGSYWIDGKEKIESLHFTLETNCTSASRYDSHDIPREHVALQPVTSCLTLHRPFNSTSDHKIHAIDCETPLNGVICSVPFDGCPTSAVTTTTARPNLQLIQ